LTIIYDIDHIINLRNQLLLLREQTRNHVLRNAASSGIEQEIQTFVLASILEIKVENCLKTKAKDIVTYALDSHKEMIAKNKA
jgi:hypothetical protein